MHASSMEQKKEVSRLAPATIGMIDQGGIAFRFRPGFLDGGIVFGGVVSKER
jgi:hypothetical protein